MAVSNSRFDFSLLRNCLKQSHEYDESRFTSKHLSIKGQQTLTKDKKFVQNKQ